MSENISNFLVELSVLSKKHGIYISGCGCCGSPFLTDDDNYDGEGEILAENLRIKEGNYVLGDKD